MDEDRLLFADEVAQVAKIEHRSVIFYASQSRRKDEMGTLTEWDMPLPDGYAKRKVATKRPGVTRTVRSPQWRESKIRQWRKVMGDRPAPQRQRDDTGRYLSRAGS